jgi:hypothetical protein
VRPALVLAGAGAAAVLLTGAAVIRVVTDPEIRDCMAASTAAGEANSAHQDAQRLLEGRFRRGGPPADEARLHVALAKGELDAARARLQLLCHYPDNPPQRPPLSTTPRELP